LSARYRTRTIFFVYLLLDVIEEFGVLERTVMNKNDVLGNREFKSLESLLRFFVSEKLFYFFSVARSVKCD